MAAGIDQIRTRESRAVEDADDGRLGGEPTEDARLVRVDVSGVPLSEVRRIVGDRGSTPVHVEHRAGSTYLVADRDRPLA